MKIERSIKLRDEAISKLREIYVMAEWCGWDSSVFHENKTKRVYNTLKEKKAPQWVVYFVTGFDECLWRDLQQNKVFFGSIVDGVLLSTHRDMPNYYEKLGHSPQVFNVQGLNKDQNNTVGQYWKKNNKPFFVGK